MDKKQLTEADIRTKFITPAIVGPSGGKWNVMTQVREEFYFTKGRVIVRGKTVKRGEAKKADYILYLKPGLPIAVIEAKDNTYSVGAGMQQALDYAETLDLPFAYSSNGDGFLEHDRTGAGGTVEREFPLDQFPSPDELWARYSKAKGYTAAQQAVATQDYYDDGSGKAPRYYQLIAINRTIEAIARGENRLLLVMATGTGKTYTAFQIIWRLWKSGAKKRILFLVDRNILADQTKTNDFKPLCLEQSVELPDWLKTRRLAEATRLAVTNDKTARLVKAVLFKAYFVYCRQIGIEWLVIAGRSPIDRQYDRMLFKDVFPDLGYIPLRHAGNLPHRVMSFHLAKTEEHEGVAGHPMFDFFFRTHHPDMDLTPSLSAMAAQNPQQLVHSQGSVSLM
jgi:hypothetical protein